MKLAIEARSVLTLCGGFRAWLTPHDANEWHEFLSKQDIWKEFKKLEAKIGAMELALGGAAATVEMIHQVSELTEKYEAMKDEMYVIGKTWYTTNIHEAVEEHFQRAAEERAWERFSRTVAGRRPVSTVEDVSARVDVLQDAVNDLAAAVGVKDLSSDLLSDLPGGSPTAAEVAEGVPPSVTHPDAFQKA